ncbi:MAG: radical SAM protein [Candidatus Omnitrophota bacterium]
MINCSKLLQHEVGELSHLHYTKHKAPVIVWNVIKECNLSCLHCYAESGFGQQDGTVSNKEAKEFIDDIASIKVPALLFSGGEPLLRKDIFDLGHYASKKGIYAALSTNGTLITEDIAGKIKDARFKYVGISLDGLESTHDNFRASKGSFKLSIKGLDNCNKLGIKTGVRFTLSKHNYKDLIKLVGYLADKGVKRFCLYHLVYSEKGRAKFEDDLGSSLKRDTLDSFFSAIEKMLDDGIDMEVLTVDNHADGVYLYQKLKAKDSGLARYAEELILKGSGCSAGVGIASVDPFGEVHPCQFWGHISLGNIQEKPFSEIWYDNNNEFLNMIRNGREKLKGRCGLCKYKTGCGGCRLRAEKRFTDLWVEDPACYLTEEEIRK